jgi:hypothetical protein
VTAQGRWAIAALGVTAALAAVLILMSVLDAPWLGFVAVALLFGALVARALMGHSIRSLLVFAGAMLGVVALAYVASALT